MLSAAHRLRSSEDFRRCIRSGSRAGGRLLVVHLLVRAADDAGLAPDPPRAGFVVSRAVGPAVTRNLVKRRLRHLTREHLTELPGGALLVVRAQPAAAQASYETLAEELASGLQRCLRKARKMALKEAPPR